MNEKILVIENQWTQFEKIRDKLLTCGEAYNIYPSDDNSHKQFLDWIRICLDTRYGGDRRMKYRQIVIEYIKNYNPDLIIIDHILVGCHNGETGIDLAIYLRKEGNISVPILFLSRSDINTPNICKQYPEIDEPRIWIPKGFKGKENLERDYFKDTVLKAIKKLLKKKKPTLKEEIINLLVENAPTPNPDESNIRIVIFRLTLEVIDLLKNNNLKANEKLKICIVNAKQSGNEMYKEILEEISLKQPVDYNSILNKINK